MLKTGGFGTKLQFNSDPMDESTGGHVATTLQVCQPGEDADVDEFIRMFDSNLDEEIQYVTEAKDEFAVLMEKMNTLAINYKVHMTKFPDVTEPAIHPIATDSTIDTSMFDNLSCFDQDVFASDVCDDISVLSNMDMQSIAAKDDIIAGEDEDIDLSSRKRARCPVSHNVIPDFHVATDDDIMYYSSLQDRYNSEIKGHWLKPSRHIWGCYTSTGDSKDNSRCNICDKIIQTPNSTYPYHLRTCHPVLYNILVINRYNKYNSKCELVCVPAEDNVHEYNHILFNIPCHCKFCSK